MPTPRFSRPWTRSVARHLAVGLAVTGALTVTACSDDGDDEPSTDVPASASSTPRDGGEGTDAAPALNEIVDCENDGGEVTASGTIENTGEETASWELTIGVLDAETDEELASGSTQVSDVAPGDTADWSVTVTGVGDADVTCKTLAITAP